MAIICLVQNIIFISALQDYTLHETWFRIKLDVSNFKIFGYLTYVRIPIELCHKLEWSRMNASFWGVGKHHVINPINSMTKQKKTIILKINVVFNEKGHVFKRRVHNI
jgi:hypothetical protein